MIYKIIIILISCCIICSCCRGPIYHTSHTKSIDSTTTISEQVRYVDTTLAIDSSVSIVEYHFDTLKQLVVDTIYTPTPSSRKAPKLYSLVPGKLSIICPSDSLQLEIALRDQIITTKIKEIDRLESTIAYKKSWKEWLYIVIQHIVYAVLYGAIVLVSYIYFQHKSRR